jgi:hypothetical protein
LVNYASSSQIAVYGMVPPFILKIFKETIHSPVGVATSYGIEGPGSISDRERFFYSP